MNSESPAEARWAAMEESYTRLRRVDPAGWREYLAELREWENLGTAPDTSAALEYPEYNGG
ncbi:hypothetical protein [Pseudofrankia sp. BMG5.36]|uniref:hypothetical protein n=1 Tax=Pseudofrankia sp. BMG5.36 TaxID=1834512 RepID=UPI001041FA0C|nr:hypothetical protein [Pseudofrankia sp. BMG5.36]